MGNTAKSDIQAAETATKADEALALRKQKLSYRAIAERMGISPTYAFKLVREAIEAIPFENAQEVRALELADIDDLERVYMPVALLGGQAVIDKDGVVALVIADTTKHAADIVLKCKAHRLKIVPSLAVPVETRTDLTVGAAEATPAQASALMKEAFGKVTPSDLAGVAEDSSGTPGEPSSG